jgi:ribosome-binding protein aMBF1 (putative translation factor)
MAKGHSYLWRKPGRRDAERKQFAALMRRLEAVRIRKGMSKTELAAELGANADGVRALKATKSR